MIEKIFRIVVNGIMFLFCVIGVFTFFMIACRSLESHPIASMACLGMSGVFVALSLIVVDYIIKTCRYDKH